VDAGFILKVDENGVNFRLGFRYGESPQTLRSLEELEESFMSTVLQVFKEYINTLRRVFLSYCNFGLIITVSGPDIAPYLTRLIPK